MNVDIPAALESLCQMLESLVADQSMRAGVVMVDTQEYLDTIAMMRDLQAYARSPEARLAQALELMNGHDYGGNVVSIASARQKRQNRIPERSKPL